MNPYPWLLALIIALSGFGSAWKVQDWRYGAKEQARAEQQLVDERQQAAREQEASAVGTRARDAAALRSADLRRRADSLRDALVRLSHSSDEALRAAAGSHIACLDTALAEHTVLKQSTERYRELAEIADRHVSDIQTMIDAAK